MAGNENHTFIDPESVRDTASHIGGLLDDIQVFEQLSQVETKAGTFETATWLENVVRDRQAGLLRHAKDLKLVLGDIKGSLDQITETFEELDKSNSNDLDRSLYHEVNVLKIEAYKDGKQVDDGVIPRRDGTIPGDDPVHHRDEPVPTRDPDIAHREVDLAEDGMVVVDDDKFVFRVGTVQHDDLDPVAGDPIPRRDGTIPGRDR